MKLIPLTKGEFAKVDDADFEWLNQWKWCLSIQGYAVRGQWSDGRVIPISMHKLILPAPGHRTDHKNQDKLDNRRSNLRIATAGQNRWNSKAPTTNKSGHKGVHWFKTSSRWQAQIMVKGKKMHLGFFLLLDEAVVARREAEQKYFGEFA